MDSYKDYKNGLCLGKFMPPHKGHLHLIDSALEECEHVFVMMCHLTNEPIPGKLRLHWLETIYKDNPRVTIIECDDENPQHPENQHDFDEVFYSIWFQSVYTRIKELDVVFTSESYGDHFARSLGIVHELVDIDRVTVPISGTKVREYSEYYWDYIPDVAKGYFANKITIVGPESTGKTTLVKNISESLGLTPFYEYGREYTDQFTDISNMTIEDYNHIAETHMLRINSLNVEQGQTIISDTEAIVTKTFAQMYLKGDINTSYLDNIIQKQKYSLYILLKPDNPWVDDGTRDFNDDSDRWKHYNLIKDELIKHKFPFYEVGGEYSERNDEIYDLIGFMCRLLVK